ncbi:MAG TPA: chemotaxis protein CheW [Methanospirillum sp.]|uniref:chemotaxis protein CheW n=1 Tax=Methanospirillum sp. TaxID=45200 RepID=UPI002C0DEDFA|nr:chemotaxis protein CheW [Methanospirillum sp.]HWQ63990.1 chemotaxis protein CheW [Methanospirillum sp.]
MEITDIDQNFNPHAHQAITPITKKGTSKKTTTEDLQFVEFTLGTECFAINLFSTKEVLTPTDITPLPNTPVYIRGVMDLRGTITTIVDLKTLLNISDTGEGKKKSRIIILDGDHSEKPIGILVDDVYSVSTHHAVEIERESENASHTTRFILGVIRKNQTSGQKLVLWLDIQKIRESIKNEL